MAMDERLETPDRFYPGIPEYMIPLFQSQARQEVKIEDIEMKVDNLQEKQDALPCAEHQETIARIEERVIALEGTKTKEEFVEAGEQIVENALKTWIKDHPNTTKGGIIGGGLCALGLVNELGLLEPLLKALGG